MSIGEGSGCEGVSRLLESNRDEMCWQKSSSILGHGDWLCAASEIGLPVYGRGNLEGDSQEHAQHLSVRPLRLPTCKPRRGVSEVARESSAASPLKGFRVEHGAAPECKGRETGDPRENPLTSAFVQHDSYMRKSGVTRRASSPVRLGGSRICILTSTPPRPLTRAACQPTSKLQGADWRAALRCDIPLADDAILLAYALMEFAEQATVSSPESTAMRTCVPCKLHIHEGERNWCAMWRVPAHKTPQTRDTAVLEDHVPQNALPSLATEPIAQRDLRGDEDFRVVSRRVKEVTSRRRSRRKR
ncbi:hypothetical protein PR048_006389 [Dryococelus australis]|uniref:Uncharacterized protein n=1 Tax=Dryococelus australis TaxID=614101 RepID=A0ABQ9IAY6_9NEOP|nr:hypothetical protein PR048_006389 [Dryococelus australis]